MRWVGKTIEENRIADAFVFSSAMAPYLFGTGINKVLDIVDVDSEKWRVYGENSGMAARVGSMGAKPTGCWRSNGVPRFPMIARCSFRPAKRTSS